MSRSYKKNSICRSRGWYGRGSKRLANKAVRKSLNLSTKQRAAYRKVFNSYDLWERISYWTKLDAISAWEEEERNAKLWNCDANRFRWHKTYGTLDNFLDKIYYRYYRRK